MKKLLRHNIFYIGVFAGVFSTLTVVFAAGLLLVWRAPWAIPFDHQPLSPQQVSLLRWNQQGFPMNFPVSDLDKQIVNDLSDITYDGNRLWVTGMTLDGLGAVFSVDPGTGRTVNEFIVGQEPRGIIFDGQHIWVANRGGSAVGETSDSPMAGSVSETPNNPMVGSVACIPISSAGGDVTVETRYLKGKEAQTTPYYLAFDGKYIWATSRDTNELWRLPANSCNPPGENDKDQDISIPIQNDKGEEISFSQPFGIIFDGTYLWIANRGSNEVMRLDPKQCTDKKCQPKEIAIGDESSNPTNLAYDGKYVWVTLEGMDQVARIDARTGWVVKPLISVGRNPWGIAYDGTYIWVANNWDESVSRLLAADGSLVENFETGGAATRFAFDGTFMWINNYGENEESFLTRR